MDKMLLKAIVVGVIGFAMCVVIASVTFQDDNGLRRQMQRRVRRIEDIMEPDELQRKRFDKEN